jgi:hypothetical protein
MPNREAVKAVRKNIMFRWLAGGQEPDYRTLNDFRGKLLTGELSRMILPGEPQAHSAIVKLRLVEAVPKLQLLGQLP